MKLESVARDEARRAGKLPMAGTEPVHMAASNASEPKTVDFKAKHSLEPVQSGSAQ
ncbi:MAG: hypothetical protein WKG03_06250 [Telluria sp.]